jgi:excisionase family DNA binding protein
MDKKTDAREVLTPEEVASYLRLGRTYTYGLLRTGALPSWKEGTRRLVRRSDVEAFVEQRLSAEKQEQGRL